MGEYLAIVVFLCVSILVSAVLCILPMFLAARDSNSEKLSTYECGFNPLSTERRNVDIKFYLVSILFIMFDLEVAFLFPWAVSLPTVGYHGFWSMVVFFALFIVGFIYEWYKGALDWE